MRLEWVALCSLLVSFTVSAVEPVRENVVAGLANDFQRWNQVSPAKLRELHGRKSRTEGDQILQGHFDTFFKSAANQQIASQPSTEEIRAALDLLRISSEIPFNAALARAPKYPTVAKPAIEEIPPPDNYSELLKWTFGLPKLTWFLPNPDVVEPDGRGGFVKRKNVKFNRDKAVRIQEADARDPFSDRSFHFDETQPLALRLDEPVESAEDFLKILHLYSHLDSGRVLIDTLTDFAASAGNSVTPIDLLGPKRDFKIIAEKEGAVEVPAGHALRPHPRVAVKFDESIEISFQRGTELGHLFLDLAYALTHDGPSGAERVAHGANLEAQHSNRDVWRETSIHEVHAEALFLQHTLYEEFIAKISKIRGRSKSELMDSYFAQLESTGTVPVVRRLATDREINEALDLKALQDRPIDIDDCLGRMKDMR